MERAIALGGRAVFGTHIPQVSIHPDLQSAISYLGADCTYRIRQLQRLARLTKWFLAKRTAIISLGAERGWSSNERDTFRKNGWKLAHLGPHVLRAETALPLLLLPLQSARPWSEQTKTTI